MVADLILLLLAVAGAFELHLSGGAFLLFFGQTRFQNRDLAQLLLLLVVVRGQLVIQRLHLHQLPLALVEFAQQLVFQLVEVVQLLLQRPGVEAQTVGELLMELFFQRQLFEVSFQLGDVLV